MDSVRDTAHELPVAWRILGLRLRGQAQYRRSFALQIVGNTSLTVMEIIAVFVFFQRFPSLGGWNLHEVLLLYAITTIAFQVADTVQNGLDFVPDHIRTGDFDKLLTRPMSLYLQALLLEVSLRQIGRFVVGVGLFVYALEHIRPDVSIGGLLLMVSSLVLAVALFVAIFSLGAIVSFWTVGSIEVVNALSYGGSNLAQYPIHIYQRWFRWVFLWIVPVGMVIYYPTLILLDKPDPLGIAPLAPILAPTMTAFFVVLVAWLWRKGTQHYHSTGS